MDARQGESPPASPSPSPASGAEPATGQDVADLVVGEGVEGPGGGVDLLDLIQGLGASAVAIALVVLTLAGMRVLLRRQAAGRSDSGFRQELTMLLLTLAGIVVILLTLPVEDAMRSQLVSLFGLLLSAAIALSSTTFLGNMMAGLMLRAVRGFRTGDFLRCGDHFGRITEMGLLHTEVQTEESDLTTLPNLHLVTTPYTVIRASGTIVTATVSLGYDVSRRKIEELLLLAAEDVELEKPFVHVIELGDFSVVYRVGGLLTEVKQLLSTRSRLRGKMMDRLHEASIEIASPTLMSTRAFQKEEAFVPAGENGVEAPPDVSSSESLEDLAFEKADQAATIDELVGRVAATQTELVALRERRKKARSDEDKRELAQDLRILELRAERQVRLLALRKEELAEREANGS